MADGSRWHRVQEVFDSVVERRPEEQAALLAEACGDDAELRAEVESLLACSQQTPADFMRPPEPPPGIRPPDVPEGPDPLIGQSIGSYRIKAVIAAGGMGTVYEAEQDQPRRIVALKVMNRYVASRSALRRFQFESQILAHLRHPNIAQVYEAGVHGGQEKGTGSEPGEADVEKESSQRGACPLFQPQPTTASVPYFAMEYIPDARSITRYAEESSLDTRDRLRLFAKVCDAVHHGHQKGIIHRDLKPGNILVDSTGEPKVIDFGVARATDSDIAVTTIQTDVGQLIGTLQYMSPEQCDADPHEIDTRSDVYSLGVVLYELLTGELPYEATGSTIVQAAQIIKEHAPGKLSAINPRLRGDVETIVLKALEKDREKRYQSAAGFAQDVRRYLNREPIAARPPTTWTKTVRWVVRNPVVATAGLCLAVAAVVTASTFISLWFVNARPHEIILLKRPGYGPLENGYEARLRSISGRILHTWASDNDGGITLAELVRRPPELGGRLLALLAFQTTHSGPLRGALWAFDAEGDLEQALWERRVKTDEILPELREARGLVAEQFGVVHAWLFDVFPTRPGSEIVAVFNAGTRSQRVLRIYDLSGELLYQVWHDGSIGHCYWMADAGLLVCSGDNQMLNWDRRGDRKNACPDPYVVFALRPTVDFIGRDWLPSQPGDDPLSPTWCLQLRPENAPAIVKEAPRFVRPEAPHDPRRSVQCSVRTRGEVSAGTWWIIDENGVEIPGTRGSENAYKLNQELPDDHPDKLPDPNSFYLAPLPAIVSTPEEAPAASDADGDNP